MREIISSEKEKEVNSFVKVFYGLIFIVLFIIGLFVFLETTHAYTYSANVFSGGTATADSDDGGGDVAGNAFDGNLATIWASGGDISPPFSPVHWLQYDLGAGNEKNIKKFNYSVYADGTGSSLKTFAIEYSTDNVNWTTAVATTSVNSTTINKTWIPIEFPTSTTASARYWRIIISDAYRADRASAWELEGYTCSDCGDIASSSATSTIGFMSPQLDFMFQLFLEMLFVASGIIVGYLAIKKLTKK